MSQASDSVAIGTLSFINGLLLNDILSTWQSVQKFVNKDYIDTGDADLSAVFGCGVS